MKTTTHTFTNFSQLEKIIRNTKVFALLNNGYSIQTQRSSLKAIAKAMKANGHPFEGIVEQDELISWSRVVISGDYQYALNGAGRSEAENTKQVRLEDEGTVRRLYDALEKILELHEADLSADDVDYINMDMAYIGIKYFMNEPDGDDEERIADDNEEYPPLTADEAIDLLSVRIDNTLQTLG